jgi:hypothetical protein
MAVGITTPRQQYTGDGVSTVFAVSFQFFLSTELAVYLTDPTTFVETLQVLDTDYLVTGGVDSVTSEPETGTVAFVTPPASGKIITIVGDPLTVQNLNLVDNDPLPAFSVNAAFDRETLIAIAIKDMANRSLRVAETEATTIGRLPRIAARKGKYLGFDATTGDPTPLDAPAGTTSVSAFGASLITAADASAANTLLGMSAYFKTLLASATAAALRALLGTPDAAETLTNKTIDFGSGANNILKATGEAAGSVPTANGSGTVTWLTPYHRNFLLNGAFEVWQRYGASPSDTVANTVSKYIADRWYLKNSLGGSGVLTGSQTAGAVDGSKYGLSVRISTAPTSGQTNGCELYQVLENADAIRLYNAIASFGVQAKALGNVTQIGISFVYEPTEIKPATVAGTPSTRQIGSEVLVTVNSSTFTRGVINGQAIGTLPTTSGVVAVRIRITGVSSGNLYDINNGFVVEQAIVSKSSFAPAFYRQNPSFAEELHACLRFYEKSIPHGSAPSAGGYAGLVQTFYPESSIVSTGLAMTKVYKVEKRATPTVRGWSLGGTADRLGNYRTASDLAASSGVAAAAGTGMVSWSNNSGGGVSITTTDGIAAHYDADAEI